MRLEACVLHHFYGQSEGDADLSILKQADCYCLRDLSVDVVIFVYHGVANLSKHVPFTL